MPGASRRRFYSRCGVTSGEWSVTGGAARTVRRGGEERSKVRHAASRAAVSSWVPSAPTTTSDEEAGASTRTGSCCRGGAGHGMPGRPPLPVEPPKPGKRPGCLADDLEGLASGTLDLAVVDADPQLDAGPTAREVGNQPAIAADGGVELRASDGRRSSHRRPATAGARTPRPSGGSAVQATSAHSPARRTWPAEGWRISPQRSLAQTEAATSRQAATDTRPPLRWSWSTRVRASPQHPGRSTPGGVLGQAGHG